MDLLDGCLAHSVLGLNKSLFYSLLVFCILLSIVMSSIGWYWEPQTSIARSGYGLASSSGNADCGSLLEESKVEIRVCDPFSVITWR